MTNPPPEWRQPQRLQHQRNFVLKSASKVYISFIFSILSRSLDYIKQGDSSSSLAPIFLLKKLFQAPISGQKQSRETDEKSSMTKSSCQLPQLLLAMTLKEGLQAYANWIACLVQLKLADCLEPDTKAVSLNCFPFDMGATTQLVIYIYRFKEVSCLQVEASCLQ